MINKQKKTDHKFKPRFKLTEIKSYASSYAYNRSELEVEVIDQSESIRDRGHLTKQELQIVGEWKTPRARARIASNSEEFIKEVTQIALSTKNEKLRIEILTLLAGVGWPTASVLLHFYHRHRYPIIDFRALYSLNCDHIKPKDYKFKFWKAYTQYTRNLAKQAGVSMRTLDKALWQYSRENQSN